MLVLTNAVASLGASAPFFKDTMNPADKVERWDITRLTPYARNSRTHSDEQISQIAASIKEWGWTTPVLVDEDGSIIAGHGRTLAAQRLKMTEVPVMVAKGWSDAKKRAYVIADNKLAMNASWNEEMLRLELAELDVAGFNLELTGFTGDDLTQAMFGNEALDVTPESSSQEIDVDDYKMGHQCPKCGFEFDEKT
jgi:ParB-like chromosome segregation protein Spo0J